MTMTIEEIVDKKNEVRRLAEAMGSSENNTGLGDALTALDKKFEKDKEGAALMSALRTALFPLCDNTSKAKKLLWDYESLLGSIMRQTHISWPPKCDGVQ